MNISLLTFMFTFAFARQISPLPLACSYNGTTYHEGDIVRTEEPCLSCVCRKGTLACNLRVCSDAPDTLPPGCFLLHKPNDCCPQILCEEGFSQNGVELRTASKMADVLTGRNCLINGSVYAEGSAILSNRTCEYCYCIRGVTKCVKPLCQQHFDGCKATYRLSSCCPTHYDCRHVDVDILNNGLKNFAKIYSSDFQRSLSNFENETEESVTEEGKTTEIPTTIETTTEVTTETETPTTTEESFTFQTMIPENLFGPAAETTPEVKDVEIRSKIDFDDVILKNSSQDGEDYDAYDYSEPKLPPSLPNLVIFPFVAADAVVKDENPETSDVSEIKRVDTHPVFFKDHFTPPIKTEGGFIPKEPSPSDVGFYDYPYIRKELLEPEPEPKPEMEVLQDADVTPDPFEGMLTEDFPKKPVTVAYKNLIVNYYPDQLITTRERYKSTTEMATEEPSQTTPAEDTFKPTTTSESSFFDEFLKSLLSEDTTTVAPATKYKYSSKIKSSTKREDVTEKKLIIKEEVKLHSKPTEDTLENRPEVEKKNQREREGSVGALLKLAGCNIYGRMYRVGKIIVELSGPCLECVCTDLGVQCRALDC